LSGGRRRVALRDWCTASVFLPEAVLSLNEIHFHDSRLIRVIEHPDTDELHFEVSYPVDWENNVFEPRVIVFTDVLNYRVEEGPFAGAPTLLDAYDNGLNGSRRSVTLQTNAGTRSLLFDSVELRLTGVEK
jgi:hypothetical protein